MLATRLRLGLCIALVVLGLTVMAGWAFGVERLTSVAPGLSSMKFNTAAAFAVFGLGLAAVTRARGPARAWAAGCGLACALFGVATLVEYAAGLDLGFDQVFVHDTGSLQGSGFPGRMSPLTAAAWVALGLGLAILALARQQGALRLAHLFGSCAGLTAFFAAAGYAFGAHAFWGFGFYTLMGVHTAIGLMTCCIAVLMTRANEGWLSGFDEAPAARAALLEFLPISVVLPLSLGLALLFGAGLGAYNAEFGLALFVPLMTAAMFALGFRIARRARNGELALRHSERRAREQLEELEAIYETSPVGLAFLTPDLKFVRVNRRLAEMNGVPAAAHIGRTIAEVVPGIADQVREISDRLKAGEPIVRYEISGETPASPGGVSHWLEYWLPLKAPDGALRGLNVVVEDITERKLAESRRRLLIDELNHRVRNTLAVVQAIARRTFAGAAASPAARRAFEERLHALAAAHTILTREHWRSADLAEIIQAAAATQGGGRLRLDGPPVALRPSMAVSLSLALHELATNAAKYGALSANEGEVRVSWRVENGRGRRLVLRWEESGGPPVVPPTRRGFGSGLLQRALGAELGGAVKLSFPPTGVICELEAQLEVDQGQAREVVPPFFQPESAGD